MVREILDFQCRDYKNACFLACDAVCSGRSVPMHMKEAFTASYSMSELTVRLPVHPGNRGKEAFYGINWKGSV